jgi:putative Mn2+ efflux pump MntP
MADHEPEQQRAGDIAPGDGADEEEVSSPFDHPAFLPVILWGMAIWFGIDGWFNPKIKSVMFNRVGFVILVVLGVYFTIQSIRDARARDQIGGDRVD